ncbi:hypothetical protein KKA14_07190 [bacterium]|nr:hypothetical protein [bacterium]
MAEQRIIDYQPATKAKRVQHVLTKEIKTSPEKIFPLACPVEELRWIPDWSYQLVYSVSGVNETNCIFTEDKSGPVLFGKPLTTTWITSLHDPVANKIKFNLNVSGKVYIAFVFNIREVGLQISAVTWDLTFTGLDEEANAMKDEEINAKLGLITGFLSETLKHYCETGKMLS